MGNRLFNPKMYEEGMEEGIERGQQVMLLKLLNKKFGEISNQYIDKIETLDSNKVEEIALNIFDINKIEDIDKLL